ncbi:hypothetical protein MRX96_047604 [Rhipicephalus microplus]
MLGESALQREGRTTGATLSASSSRDLGEENELPLENGGGGEGEGGNGQRGHPTTLRQPTAPQLEPFDKRATGLRDGRSEGSGDRCNGDERSSPDKLGTQQ